MTVENKSVDYQLPEGPSIASLRMSLLDDIDAGILTEKEAGLIEEYFVEHPEKLSLMVEK